MKGVESYGRGKLRRLRAEADLKDVLLTNSHQSVQLRRGIFFPVCASGEDDGAGFVNIPLSLVALPIDYAAAVCAPAMAHDIETERG